MVVTIEDARAAIARTVPVPVGKVGREAGKLYRRLLALEEAGEIHWDARAATWIRTPEHRVGVTTSRPDPYQPADLLSRFERVRRQGRGWRACCPSHEDRTPSLTIAEGRDGWLLHCWAGCHFDDVVTAARLETRRLFWK